MRRNKSNLNNKIKSGKQSNKKILLAFNETETNIGNLNANKNEKSGLKKDNFQQKHITKTTDKVNTNIVDIKDAEKVITREENY